MKSAAFLLLAIAAAPLSGWGKEPVPKYTFVIIEPRNAPGKEAPHEFLVLNAGHVPTAKKDGHPVHD